MSKSPAASRAIAPPQLCWLYFDHECSEIWHYLLSPLVDPESSAVADASLHHYGRLRRLLLPDRLLKQRAAMTQALDYTLSASFCAFSLPAKSLFNVALQLARCGNFTGSQDSEPFVEQPFSMASPSSLEHLSQSR